MSDSQTRDYTSYDRPEDITGDDSLSHTQKMVLLEAWAEDEEAKARATAEGLDGGNDTQLRAIRKLMSDLEQYGK